MQIARLLLIKCSDNEFTHLLSASQWVADMDTQSEEALKLADK